MSISYNGLYKTLEKNKDKKNLNSSITVRVDDTAKKEFEEICAKMGMTVSSAVNAFIEKVINLKALPFTINGYKRKRKLFIAEGKFNDVSDEEWQKMDDEIIEMFESSDDENEYFN
ncbi:MAG: type II toxin-antitoxin system RelB/DinJ family antitoxin [Lachnospiraceae bacterium]|nr:type II toxin-antitoxin system RelB/DinJ family antitoxin [Lachnospiraceae bacterium]